MDKQNVITNMFENSRGFQNIVNSCKYIKFKAKENLKMNILLIVILLWLFVEIYLDRKSLKNEKYSKLTYTIIVINFMGYVCLYGLYGLTPKFIQMIFLISILSYLSIIDLKYNIIPNKIVAIIFIFGIFYNIVNRTLSFGNMATGFFIISVPLLIMSIILKGSMGGGDIKLMAVTGAFLGWENIIVAFLIASIIGSIISIILILLGKIKGKDMIPYGPFLSIGIFVASLYGEKIIRVYTGI